MVGQEQSFTLRLEIKTNALSTLPGFRHTGLPFVDSRLLRAIAPDIPTTTLVLVIEHISISKFLSRVNNYAINPSQEFTAIGVANLLGPFLGALPQTGSFSRTAIQAKAGVRTPLAGLFTAAIVLLALYALTSVFFYVPSAVLSAIIIHAVGDLITPPRELWRIWRASPVEIVVYFVGVFFSIFTSLEDGIYVTVCLGAAILLFRIAKDEGRFLGRLHVSEVSRDAVPHSRSKVPSTDGHAAENKLREVFVPLDHSDLSNPRAAVTSPYPGVFVYRFGESFNYLNCAHHLDILATNILRQTRMTELEHHAKVGVR